MQRLQNAWNIGVMDFEKMADFAKKEAFDLVVVGPDDPLAGGIVDVLEEKGIACVRTKKECSDLRGIQGIFQGSDEEIRHSDSSL